MNFNDLDWTKVNPILILVFGRCYHLSIESYNLELQICGGYKNARLTNLGRAGGPLYSLLSPASPGGIGSLVVNTWLVCCWCWPLVDLLPLWISCRSSPGPFKQTVHSSTNIHIHEHIKSQPCSACFSLKLQVRSASPSLAVMHISTPAHPCNSWKCI